MRIAIGLTALAVAVALMAGCGPTGPAAPGGQAVDPVTVADALPSPEPLVPEGGAEPADLADFVEATLGAEPETVDALSERGFEGAAVRTWSALPEGGMTVSVSVWSSGVVATGVAGSIPERLLDEAGAGAWTARAVPGSRGARAPGGKRWIGKSVGPNAIVVQAEGSVPEGIVVRQLRRLVTVAEAQSDS